MKENLMKKSKKKKGFTLIELIIVIAIISILVGLAIPKLMGVQQDSKIRTDIANAKTIANAVATLITQDKITPEAVDASTGITLKDSSDTGKAKVIDDYLQTIPAPKAVSGKQFVVKIQPEVAEVKDDKGVVTKKGESANIIVEVDGKQLYPQPNEAYGK